MKQKLLWIPKGKDISAYALKCDPVPFKDKTPDIVWTLFLETNENKPPQLPIIPKHNHNAFLEDKMHDWNVRNGEFHYYSRISEGEVYLLLEWKD